MKRVEGPSEGGLGPGDTDEMNVVSQQAVGPNIKSASTRIFGEPLEVTNVVGFFFEYVLIIVPALCDLMRVTEDRMAGCPNHVLCDKGAVQATAGGLYVDEDCQSASSIEVGARCARG